MAGVFDLGANGLFGLGGASRVFLFPVWGGGGGVGGLVDSMVSGGAGVCRGCTWEFGV